MSNATIRSSTARKLGLAALLAFSLLLGIKLVFVGKTSLLTILTPSYLALAYVLVKLPRYSDALCSGLTLLVLLSYVLLSFYLFDLLFLVSLPIVALFLLLPAVKALRLGLLFLLCVLLVQIVGSPVGPPDVILNVSPAVFICLLSHWLATQIQFANDALHESMRADALTGVANREVLKEDLLDAVQMLERYTIPSTACLIHLCDNERLQDELGERKLNDLVNQLVGIWTSRIRNTDTLYRYDNAKFILLMPATSEDDARHVCVDLEKATEAYELNHIENVRIATRCISADSQMDWEQWLAALVKA